MAAEIGKETSSLDDLPFENYQYEKVWSLDSAVKKRHVLQLANI